MHFRGACRLTETGTSDIILAGQLFINLLNFYPMAKIPFGILGPFFGKTGTVSGYTWKGIPVMRALPAESNKQPTEAQLQQRAKFGFTSKFLGGLSTFIKTGFRELAKGRTEFQCAMSYNMAHAIGGAYPDFRIHYAQVAVSRGQLPNVASPEAKTEGSHLRVFWEDNSGVGWAAASDRAIVVLYWPALNVWSYYNPGPQRADCTMVVPVADRENHPFHAWLTFTSKAGAMADSEYIGEFVMA